MSSLQKRKRHGVATCKERASGDEEEESAYQQLLSLLGPRRRRRRVLQKKTIGHSGVATVSGDHAGYSDGEVDVSSPAVCDGESGEAGERDGNPPSEAEEESDHGHISDKESDDSSGWGSGDSGDETREQDSTVKDPFSEHLDPVLSPKEVATLESVTFSPSSPSQLGPLGVVSRWPGLQGREPQLSYDSHSLSKLHVKQRLAHNWKNGKTSASFSELQRHLFSLMNSYVDVLYTQRTFENAEELRRLYVLHVLNHVLKTRSRVLRNNRKLLQASKDGRHIEEPRDQGLTRPKALILLPFRHSALQVVNILTSLLVPTGQGHVHNHRRFHREFCDATGGPRPSKVPKASSYIAMFAGNTDDCFKVGVALRGKVVRLYTDFYSSDIIIASPLGLRTIIGVEGEKRDFDFLSSVELLVLDQTDVFLMQNWEHLTHVLSHLHRRPSESHDVDFSRVRLWTLNEWSHFYRQTMIFSSFQTPEINSLLTTYCHNYAGGVRCDQSGGGGVGSMGQVARQLPQVFTRITSPSFSELPDSRIHHFTVQVLPGYQTELMKGTVIFIPSYFDFVRLRNLMKKQELSYAAISEYTTSSGVARARTQFYQGLKHFLLYTERAHFFHRYRLRGVHHVLLYSLPTYPEHYSDVVNMVEAEEGTVEVLHSQWEQLALVRIVGHARAHRMNSSTDSTHMLVTSHRQ